jgi:TetR/AcrR family transcriptional repressor of nem operon
MPRDGTQTRERILDAAERLVLDFGFGATSVDQVIAASNTSKGAFFHHFESKNDLARALVDRVVAADHRQLEAALAASADVTNPVDRLLEFLKYFERRAASLSGADADCLYISVLTERQLIDTGTSERIATIIETWRAAIAALVKGALRSRGRSRLVDAEVLADHVFATFEGSYLLNRALGESHHLAAQLGVLRKLLAAVLADAPATPSRPARRPSSPRRAARTTP